MQTPVFRSGGETRVTLTGKVSGSIPTWLSGELLRVGPGIQEFGQDHYNYLIDGLAIIHKIQIDRGVVSYDSKILRSDAYLRNKEAERIVVSEVGTLAIPDPCASWFQRVKTEAKCVFLGEDSNMSDNCNVNLALHGDQLFALTDGLFTRRIDSETLETVGGRVRTGDFVAINSSTAHPHFLNDGSAIYAGSNFRSSKGPHYCFFKVPPTFDNDTPCFSNAKMIAEIPCRWKYYPSYFHSFGITSSGKLIFIEAPFCVNVWKIITLQTLTKPLLSLMEWYNDQTTRFHVVDLKSGSHHAVIYETKNLLVMHHINAYEEDDKIIVDVIGYDDAKTAMELFEYKKIDSNSKKESFPTLRRYVLPLLEGTADCCSSQEKQFVKVSGEVLVKNYLELPQINYSYNGKKYKYFYSLGNPDDSSPMNLGRYIAKVDVVKNCIIHYDVGEMLRGCEPIFVADLSSPNPAEDDGVLLSLLLSNSDPDFVRLLILDAKTMDEMATVDFKTEEAVSFTLHGFWKKAVENPLL